METLEEYLNRERALLNKFEKYWKKEHSKNPEIFPMELEPGAWFEQLQAFDEAHDLQGN